MTSFVNLLSTLILLDQLRPVILLERARKAQNLPAAGQVHDAIARSWRIRTEILLHHCIKMLDTSLRDTGLPADDYMTTISLRHICKILFHRLSGSLGTLYGCKPVRVFPIKCATIPVDVLHVAPRYPPSHINWTLYVTGGIRINSLARTPLSCVQQSLQMCSAFSLCWIQPFHVC